MTAPLEAAARRDLYALTARLFAAEVDVALYRALDVHFVNPLPVSLSLATVYNGSHANVVVDTSLLF